MLKRLWHKIKAALKKPEPDVLGAAIIGTTIGRVGFYGAFGVSFFMAGLAHYSLIFFTVLLIETFIQMEVLYFLREATAQDR